MGENNIQAASNEIAALVNMYGPGTAPVKHGGQAIRLLALAQEEMDGLRVEMDGLREQNARRLAEIESLHQTVDALNSKIEEAQTALVPVAAETLVLDRTPESPYLPGMEPQDSLDVNSNSEGPVI